MAQLVWDATGEKFYETGTDHGVLYVAGQSPVPWNGLTAVTEAPSGAEETALYADNIKYGSISSAEEFGGTIEAYTYPDEFAVCDGSAEAAPGVFVGQQGRKPFGFSYRTKVVNDEGNEFYKYHFIYGCKAAPSEKAYTTINDSPEAITFSWEFTTTPVAFPAPHANSATLTIDGSKLGADAATKITALEALVYDDTATGMPAPEDILDIFLA